MIFQQEKVLPISDYLAEAALWIVKTTSTATVCCGEWAVALLLMNKKSKSRLKVLKFQRRVDLLLR